MRMKRVLRWIVLGIVILGLCLFFVRAKSQKGGMPDMRGGATVPVRTATARSQDVPYFLQGIGTVVPSSDVLVKSRVTGQLMQLHFQEGQYVRAGDLLAEIDPRPFRAALQEAEGRLASDRAQLANAKRDLERYASLVQRDYVERQKYDTQKALVAQYEGAVVSDRAACETARLQLEYSRITAPASGITGLRKVDVGNQITTSDADIVRITEVSPCDILFTLPETTVSLVIKAVAASKTKPIVVQAWDRAQKHLLAKGALLSLDNEIDTETGTVRVKARFANADKSLYPNQFVNARLCVDIVRNAVTVPAAAIQIGSKGTYVYVVRQTVNDSKDVPGKARPASRGTVHVRTVSLGLETPRLVVVTEGLKAQEMVVVDGVDRLRDGASVSITNTTDTPMAESIAEASE